MEQVCTSNWSISLLTISARRTKWNRHTLLNVHKLLTEDAKCYSIKYTWNRTLLHFYCLNVHIMWLEVSHIQKYISFKALLNINSVSLFRSRSQDIFLIFPKQWDLDPYFYDLEHFMNQLLKKTKLLGQSPWVNYTNWATAACRQS
jgi:hypothetical protein